MSHMYFKITHLNSVYCRQLLGSIIETKKYNQQLLSVMKILENPKIKVLKCNESSKTK